MSATRLRQNVYQTLDRVLQTGQSLVIRRKGKRLRLSPEKIPDRVGKLRAHAGCFKGNPNQLLEIDWSKSWKP